MRLTKILKDQGYDLIDGPSRNHEICQLWIDDPWDRLQIFYDHLDYAFKSSISFNPQPKPSLDLVYSSKNTFAFNVGISVAKAILEALGLNGLGLTLAFKNGKSLSVSYSGSFSREIPLGEIRDYFENADFHHPNSTLLRDLNRNRVILISGIIYAKYLRIEIENESDFSAKIEADINEILQGTFDISLSSKRKIQLTSNGDYYFPVAVKAHVLKYRKGEFIDAELLTDSGDRF